jgi:TetR/AcrR family transcriptional repressor of lmrAB and yxaGH operons
MGTTTKPPLALRERNRLRVRADILDAVATSLAADHGYAGTTLDEIRARAGMSRATLYTYFPGGREEMVREAYLRAADAVYVAGIGLREKETTAAGRIEALATAFVAHVRTPTGRFYGLMGPDTASAVGEALGSTSRPFQDLIKQDLGAALQDGQLAPNSPLDALAACLTGALKSAGAVAARHEDTAGDHLAAVKQLVESLLSSRSSNR